MEKLKGKLVLIVDDEERNIFALGSYLEGMDMKVITAPHGKRALEILRVTDNVSMVLLDMMMPVMDGFETLAVLKNDEYLKHIPVIAVTAKAMKGDREKCLEAGAWDYASKPLDMKQLIDKLNRWII